LQRDECHDLHITLTHIVSEMQSAHPQRAIEADIAPLGGIRCDADRLAQLLSNLLANALVHGSAAGRVFVRAVIENGRLSLSVNNQGEPIAPDRLAQLFKPYWREASNTQSGLGLGLYIANEIAASHGGSMQVTSTAEAGTTFTFSMPTGAALV